MPTAVKGPPSPHALGRPDRWAERTSAPRRRREPLQRLTLPTAPQFPLATAAADAPAPPRRRRAAPLRDVTAADDDVAGGSLPPPLPHLALPPFLTALLDPAASVDLPAGPVAAALALDNRELDKLVAALGRCRATWRRALVLREWLLAAGHALDDRLCTTLLRVCSQHGAAVTALGLYDWMKAPAEEGGAALTPTVFTYTAAMRAALGGGLVPRALAVWEDAVAAGCEPDCRLATALVEAAARAGDTDRALAAYRGMRDASPGSRLSPSVHAYTATMRAAAEGGRPDAALAVWDDMAAARVRPTGHAYAAAITACAAHTSADPPPGTGWRRAVALFDDMLARGVKADVVSCTALVGALAAAARSDDAHAVVQWMLAAGVRPNVRTYTALLAAHAAGKRWDRALGTLAALKRGGAGVSAGVEPNAYTYSALIKAAGEQGLWQLAEAIFGELEADALAARAAGAAPSAAPIPPATPPRRGGLDLGRRDAAATAAAARAASFDARRGSLDVLASTLAEQVLLDDAPSPASPASPPPRPPTPFAATAAPRALAAYTWAAAAPASAAAAAADASNPWGGAAADAAAVPAAWAAARTADAAPAAATATARAPPLNEVVCGALMAAYDKAGRPDDALGVLPRARAAGVAPNVVMHNIALSALGRAGRYEEAAALFAAMPTRDAVSHETLLGAAAAAARPADAEAAFAALLEAGHTPSDHAWCGLVAAHAAAGDTSAALRVADRRAAATAPATGAKKPAPSLPLFNALLAACERGRAWDAAISVAAAMRDAGVAPDAATARLLNAVASGGKASVEDQQLAAAALSAALAAAGGLLMRSGMF